MPEWVQVRAAAGKLAASLIAGGLLLACEASLVATSDTTEHPDATTEPGVDGGEPRPLTDAGPAIPPGRAGAVIAIGKFARIAMSCDDGASWPVDFSDDDRASCAGIDCDHHPGSSTGITSGGGHVYASFGWGEVNTRIFRSTDGVDWSVVYDASEYSVAGLAWAGDRLVGASPWVIRSVDLGVSFEASAWPDYDVPDGTWPNARRIGYAPADGGRIALLSANGDGTWGDTTVSRDGARTFLHPTSVDERCRGWARDMLYSDGVWLQVWGGNDGTVCRSVDGGDTWTAAVLNADRPFDMTQAMFTGEEFVLFAGEQGFRSADGASWESFAMDAFVSVAAYTPATGTFLGVHESYDRQRMVRSTDGGRHWEPVSSFRQGHPITYLHFTDVATSATCPGE